MAMPSVYDLSQRIENGMPYFPGDPVPTIVPASSAQAPWLVTKLQMGTHTGTHIDSPAHFYPGGKTIDQVELPRFVVPGLVLPVPGLDDDRAIGAEHIQGMLSHLPEGGGVILRTDWSRYWGKEQYFRHPYLSTEAAQLIVSAGAGIVGIDALNVDSTVQETSTVHEIFLSKDILIVENLTGLAQLRPEVLYQFSFLPLFLSGLDGSPVRAIASEYL
jgi:kynurenine formamidase